MFEYLLKIHCYSVIMNMKNKRILVKIFVQCIFKDVCVDVNYAGMYNLIIAIIVCEGNILSVSSICLYCKYWPYISPYTVSLRRALYMHCGSHYVTSRKTIIDVFSWREKMSLLRNRCATFHDETIRFRLSVCWCQKSEFFFIF